MDTAGIVVTIIIIAVAIGIGVVIKLRRKQEVKPVDPCADGSCTPVVDPCADGSCKPVDPCADGSCTPVEPVEPVKPKFSGTIKIVLSADNGTQKNIIPGSICTRSVGIKATETITKNDCADCVIREWFDNGVLIPAATGLTELKQSTNRFLSGHTITYKVTIDEVSASATAKIL
jgi:hypothetical protein